MRSRALCRVCARRVLRHTQQRVPCRTAAAHAARWGASPSSRCRQRTWHPCHRDHASCLCGGRAGAARCCRRRRPCPDRAAATCDLLTLAASSGCHSSVMRRCRQALMPRGRNRAEQQTRMRRQRRRRV
jgi:hypothetical protein